MTRPATVQPSPRTTTQTLITAACLVLLGVLTPFIVIVGVAATALVGPLALIAGPVVGVLVSRGLAAYCRHRVGPRWFWLYVAAAACCFAFMIVPELLPRHPSGGGATMEGALAATYGQGLVFLLLCACTLLWLLGLALAATKQD